MPAMKAVPVHVQNYFIHSLLLKQLLLLLFQWKVTATVKLSIVFQFSRELHQNIPEKMNIASLKFDTIGYDSRQKIDLSLNMQLVMR